MTKKDFPKNPVNLKKDFGSLKHILKKSTQEIKNELRREEFNIELRKEKNK
ncbi:MAG TPA: hypothetical protein VJJ23_01435 [Candidatus Nanoarchaeia archaeon]|nr:hypothetical protein [Candidatus Nanoarchaeia archaeon]